MKKKSTLSKYLWYRLITVLYFISLLTAVVIYAFKTYDTFLEYPLNTSKTRIWCKLDWYSEYFDIKKDKYWIVGPLTENQKKIIAEEICWKYNVSIIDYKINYEKDSFWLMANNNIFTASNSVMEVRLNYWRLAIAILIILWWWFVVTRILRKLLYYIVVWVENK